MTDFAAQWRAEENAFEDDNKLKEMRALLVKGAISQEAYDEMLRYVKENGMSQKELQKIQKERSKKNIGKFNVKPMMEGSLYRRTKKKKWRKRYFKLYSDRLDYHKNRLEPEPLGSILLSKDFYVADSILRRIKNTRPNGFMISDFAQSIYLAAETPEDKTYWIHTLGRVVRKLKESDQETDRPMMLGARGATKELQEQEYQARLQAYQKLNKTKSAAVKAAKEAPKKDEGIKKRNTLNKKKKKAKRNTLENKQKGAKKKPSGKEVEPEPASAARTAKPARNAPAPEDDTKLTRAESMGNVAVELLSRTETKASATPRIPSLVLREESRQSKAQSQASAAMAAHMSARESVKSNLGLNVMSYGEQEDLRDQASNAQRIKVLKKIENEAATDRLDRVLTKERALKADLKTARALGDQDAIAEAEEMYIVAKSELKAAEADVVRTAAERLEAEDVQGRTEQLVAESSAANAIVMELAKVDVAILEAEQLVENAESARRRAQEAAERVKAEAAAEAAQAEREERAAAEAAAKAAEEERKKREQERKALAKLEEATRKQASEAEAARMRTQLEAAAKARAEAEQARFQAELEAAQMEAAKLDSMAKAAAVEKALRETQALLEAANEENSMDALGFAALRREKEETHKTRASAKLGKQKTSEKRSSSIVQRIRTSMTRGGKKSARPKTLEKKGKAAPPPKGKKKGRMNTLDKKSAKTVNAINTVDQGPTEASSSFVNFLSGWATTAVEGVEYVTGLRLMEDLSDTEEEDSDFDSLLSDSDIGSSDDEDDRYDRQLSAVGEEERMKAAAAWIEFEINRLADIIAEIGELDRYGRPAVTFRDLLDVYSDLSDTLVGILMRAKSAGVIYYDGDMLFEIEDDDKTITLLEEE